jgi:hypothetical protein
MASFHLFGVPDYITNPTSGELDTFKFPEGLGKFSFPNDITKTPSAQPKQAKIKPSEVPSEGIVEDLLSAAKVPFSALVPKPQVKVPGIRRAVKLQKVTIKEGSGILIYQKGSQFALHVRVSGRGFAVWQQSCDLESQNHPNWVQIPTRKKTLGGSLMGFTKAVVKGTILFAFKQTVWILIMNDMPNSNPPRMGPLTRPTHAPVHLITGGSKEKVKVT